MKYGAMTGLGLFIVFIIANILALNSQGVQQFISYAVLITGIFTGIKNFRDNELGGSISYSTALWSGTKIAFFCSIIISFGMFLYLKLVDDSMIEKILQQTEQKLIEQGMADSDIEKSMDVSRKFTSPAMMAIFGVLGNTLMGFLFSLGIAGLLKKSGNPYDTFMNENQ